MFFISFRAFLIVRVFFQPDNACGEKPSEYNYVIIFGGGLFPTCLIHFCMMQSVKGVIRVAEEYEIIMFSGRLFSTSNELQLVL
jgi:hypothetical protein